MFRTLLGRTIRSNLTSTFKLNVISRTRLLGTSVKPGIQTTITTTATTTIMPDITPRPSSRSPSPPAKRARLDPPTSMNPTHQDFPTAPIEQAQASSSSNPTPTPTSDEKDTLDDLVERETNGDIEVPRTYTKEIDYENKLVLAPMVRTGSSEFPKASRYELWFGWLAYHMISLERVTSVPCVSPGSFSGPRDIAQYDTHFRNIICCRISRWIINHHSDSCHCTTKPV
jgi:hypothetical protein